MVVILLSGLILPFTTTKPAYAATVLIVNSTQDSLSNDGKCTLREAVISANKNKPSGSKPNECVAGTADDIIRLQANQVYQITRTDSGNEDSSASGDLDIRANITFEVTGSGLATIQAVNSRDRLFQVFSGSTSFSNLVIMGGNIAGSGGAIANQSTAIIKNSLIKGNISSGRGGGIYNSAGATLTLSSSTITANTSSTDGGGIANEGTLSLTNATISGNTSKGGGGGFFSSGSSTLNAVTVAANSAGSLSGNGGGLAVAAGVTTIKNTLIAGNTSEAALPAPDCSGSLQSAGYNLLQNTSSCVLTGNLTGNLLGLDPKLGQPGKQWGLTPPTPS
jgi:CSLREA domain-containing protein